MPQSKASKAPLSGISDLPIPQSYPPILAIDEVPELSGRLVYVIEGYKLSGYSILVFNHEGNIGIRCGDFDGNMIDPPDGAREHVDKLLPLMKAGRIEFAQFYFSDDMLVDIRVSLDKMAGPGMLKDLCGNVVQTQKIIDIKQFDDDLKEKLPELGYVILKHSSFKTIIRDGKILPLYGLSTADATRKTRRKLR